MTNSIETPIHEVVREHYGSLARSASSCCGPSSCDCNSLYPVDLTAGLPGDVTQFSLGCGDPITLAGLQPGDVVVDLGSGGGMDCFLAAQKVGATGRVIGVDMTPDMLVKARANAVRLAVTNAEFRQGYIEALPVADDEATVIISNCVINLSPDKPQVFREMFRALRPGGRIAVSDIVTSGPLPEAVRSDMEAWGACVAGALDAGDFRAGLEAAGFVEVTVQPKGEFAPGLTAMPANAPFSATITARKPAA
jgi:ubiquinone/menaquinone biosynthesis C-methylase UbiE